MKKSSLILLISLIFSQVALADCTYQIDETLNISDLEFNQNNKNTFLQLKKYEFDVDSTNILSVHHLEAKAAFPYINFYGIFSTLFMGMTKMRNEFELKLTKRNEKPEIVSSYYFYFGDTQQRAQGSYPKSYEKGINRALMKFQVCEK